MHWKTVILALIVMLFTTACVGTSEEKGIGKKENSHIQTFVKESKYPNMEIETEIGEYDKYKYAIHFPRTKQKQINLTIREFIKEHKKQFLNDAQKIQPKGNDYSELLLDYDITHLSDNIISIVFNNNVKLAGKESTERNYTLNFQLNSGKQISLEELLLDYSSLQQIADISQNKILQDAKTMKLTNYDRVIDGTAPKVANYESFSFSNHSLDFYFKEKQIGPKSIGPYKVEVAINDLNGIVKDSYMHSLEQVFSNETEILSNTTTNKEEKKSSLSPDGKYVAITFDDGPHHQLTPYILDILKKHKAKATFFVLGNRVEYYPEIVKRTFDEGHEIGNHSWSHPKLTSLSQQELRNQIYHTSSAVAKITGVAPATIRPPYGAFNDQVKQVLNGPIVNWSVDTLDWKHHNKEMIKKIVREKTRNGSIILMHDIHSATAQALDSVLTELSQKGYQFVTVSQLLEIEDQANNVPGQVFLNKPAS
ncbi:MULTISPECIES: polysaccharide deacetylase family protein [Bacillus]|uniref:polysaccharide deacetylase family protein n=1 Tax=Bacillus TaxID=1386 RepID=UPI0002EFDDA4|nr:MULTISPECIES: polysaccharide deacetylase family protein [Bacillus]